MLLFLSLVVNFLIFKAGLFAVDKIFNDCGEFIGNVLEHCLWNGLGQSQQVVCCESELPDAVDPELVTLPLHVLQED